MVFLLYVGPDRRAFACTGDSMRSREIFPQHDESAQHLCRSLLPGGMRPGGPRPRAYTARRALTHSARSLGSGCQRLREKGLIGQILKQPKMVAEGVVEIAPRSASFDALDRRHCQAQRLLETVALVREIPDPPPDAHHAAASLP